MVNQDLMQEIGDEIVTNLRVNFKQPNLDNLCYAFLWGTLITQCYRFKISLSLHLWNELEYLPDWMFSQGALYLLVYK